MTSALRKGLLQCKPLMNLGVGEAGESKQALQGMGGGLGGGHPVRRCESLWDREEGWSWGKTRWRWSSEFSKVWTHTLLSDTQAMWSSCGRCSCSSHGFSSPTGRSWGRTACSSASRHSTGTASSRSVSGGGRHGVPQGWAQDTGDPQRANAIERKRRVGLWGSVGTASH